MCIEPISWTLAFNQCISFCNNHEHKINEELKNPSSFNKIMDEDLGMVNELTLLASSIKKGFNCSSFYVILEKYEKKTQTYYP